MNRFMIAKTWLTCGFLIMAVFSYAANKGISERNIDIAGLVINAQNLLPIDSARIYDLKNNMLGFTDSRGYFKIMIKYAKPGALNFKLKIVKQGYQAFLQHENWADKPGYTTAIMYFGLQKSNSRAKPFSSLEGTGLDLTYDNVFSRFDKVKEERKFNNKLESAKAGNENVFIQIDGKLYIVNNSGWIEISSDKDLISLNNKLTFEARKLNSVLKRKDIKWMTSLDKKPEKFGIYTR